MADQSDDSLRAAFDRFYQVLEATTIPFGKGRRVDGIPHAVALSEATRILHNELAAAVDRLYGLHGNPSAEYMAGVTLEEADSPEGPWSTVPPEDVRASWMPIGGKAADAILLAALQSAARVAAFPSDRWNALQAAQPGADHQRWQGGDTIEADALARLESARKLFAFTDELQTVPTTDNAAETTPTIEHVAGEPSLSPTKLAESFAVRADAQGKAGTLQHSTPHSDDFTSVNWFGMRYAFTKGNQAEAVRVLWHAWEQGGHSLTQETIGERIGSSAVRFELAKVFRSRKREGGYVQHAAWGTMIQQDSKGSYRLIQPDSD